jgi:transcriptional regulator with XRE-family HTH domain
MSRGGSPNDYRPTRAHHVINRLRQSRISAGLTQRELAEILGYSNQDIYRLENGTRIARFQLIIDYANYLGYDLALVPKEKP